MFVLFNWGDEAEDLGPAIPIQCPNCNNRAYLRLIHARTKAGIFFLTLARFRSRYALVCEVCHHGFALSGRDVEIAKSLTRAVQAVDDGNMTIDQYQALIEGSGILGITSAHARRIG